MRVSLGHAICASLLLLMLPLSGPFNPHQSFLESGSFETQYSNDSGSSINFTSSGGSGLAISGEPAHVGDKLFATLLVSNSGNSSGTVSLHIFSEIYAIEFQGEFVEISPGSTREVSAPFSPSSPGENQFYWWLSVVEFGDYFPLEGNISVEVMPSQNLNLSIDKIEWKSDSGLNVDASVFLSYGKSREIILEVSSLSQGSIELMQRIELESDPGRREINFNLGHPNAEEITIEAIPVLWQPSNTSENMTMSLVKEPLVDSQSLIIAVEFTPEDPVPGKEVLTSVSVENTGTYMVKSGEIRVIMASDRTILAQTSVQSVMPGSTIRTDLNIPIWPEGDRTDLEVQWSTSEVVVSSYYSIDANSGDEGLDLPFDIIAAGYGVLAGVLTLLVGTFVWRAVSTRTPSTSDLTLRETKQESASFSKIEKREIQCSYCDQRLMVPSDHDGGVRCPSCSMEFIVGEPQEDSPRVVRSSVDTLSCPECEQVLRVKLEKRPVMSRCPVCKTNFMAESEGE